MKIIAVIVRVARRTDISALVAEQQDALPLLEAQLLLIVEAVIGVALAWFGILRAGLQQ